MQVNYDYIKNVHADDCKLILGHNQFLNEEFTLLKVYYYNNLDEYTVLYNGRNNEYEIKTYCINENMKKDANNLHDVVHVVFINPYFSVVYEVLDALKFKTVYVHNMPYLDTHMKNVYISDINLDNDMYELYDKNKGECNVSNLYKVKRNIKTVGRTIGNKLKSYVKSKIKRTYNPTHIPVYRPTYRNDDYGIEMYDMTTNEPIVSVTKNDILMTKNDFSTIRPNFLTRQSISMNKPNFSTNRPSISTMPKVSSLKPDDDYLSKMRSLKNTKGPNLKTLISESRKETRKKSKKIQFDKSVNFTNKKTKR